MKQRVRELTESDRAQSDRLGAEAFGRSPAPATSTDAAAATTPAAWPPPGCTATGAFAADELIAKVVVKDFASFFHGQALSTAGVAGVTVAPEHRGRGVLGPVMHQALAQAAEAGAVLSTLFPTAANIYRRSGFETISSIRTIDLDMASLASMLPRRGNSESAADHVTVRRATAADLDGLQGCYLMWAQAHNGPLTRTGPCFAGLSDDFLDFTGTTIAEDPDGTILGYCSWDRGTGYGPNVTIDTYDLIAVTPQAYRALCAMLVSFASVAGTVRVRTSGWGELDLLLGAGEPALVRDQPYMLRLLDVPRALAALPAPPGANWSLDLAVIDDQLTGGCYRITVEDGVLAATRTRSTVAASRRRSDEVQFTARGLALWWSGRMALRNVRMAGLATGGVSQDAHFDSLVSARPLQIRDYF